MARNVLVVKKRSRKPLIVKKRGGGRNYPIYYGKYARARAMGGGGPSTSDYAKVRENYTFQLPAGQMTFFRATELAEVNFDRAQAVAQAYQQFRIKYIKLTFQPAFDTFPAGGPGNARVPQLYFMIDKNNSIPTNANAATMASVGARPYRLDDKNIVRAWKPTVLVSNMIAPGAAAANQVLVSPWLSTNENAGNPQAAWAPCATDHLGAVFYVTNIVPADATVYNVTVECMFEFRKPNWKAAQGQEAN